MTNQRVAFIGLGEMGAPMATNVRAAGYDLIVVARRPEVTEQFVRMGATAVPSPREAAQDADFVISMVRDDRQTEDVMFGNQGVLEGCRTGTDIIVMSTITVRMLRRLGADAERRGISLIDAPVSGAQERAVPGTLTVIVGGNQNVYERCKPLLQTMGHQIFYMGGLGTGLAAKIINNMLCAINVMGTREALRLGASAGIDPPALIDMVSTASGSNYMLKRFTNVEEMLHVGQSFRPGGNWAILQKDIHMANAFAGDQHVDLPILSLVEQLYDALDLTPGKNPFLPDKR